MGFLKAITQQLTKRELQNIKLIRTTRIPEIKTLPIEYTLLNSLIKIKISPEYSFEEPELSSEEKNIYHLIEDSLIEIIDIQENTSIDEYLEKAIRIIISELNLTLNETSLQKILYYSYRNIIGLKKLQPLIEDQLVTEIKYNKTLTIEHKLFKTLKTNIQLSREEIYFILRKLSLKANKELSLENPNIKFTDNKTEYSFNFASEIENSTFSIKRTTPKKYLPTELIKSRKCSPEILAFLWLLVEDHNNVFFVNNTTYLQTISYLLPPHSKIFTNLTTYFPNVYTSTNIGPIPEGDEDFGIINDYKGQYLKSTLIASIEKPLSDSITCEIEDEKIINIKEAQKELFKYSEEKFLFNLEESNFMKSKGNKAILIEEFKLRTKLLLYLSKTTLTEENFLKIIYAYYENPVKVLEKTKIL